ncbi:hypothetical protein MLD52_16210 [Puniceicoccaceae bacterium K14]|nr:hypothetical protein [Puniceicoccaceae bacterium K14]
MKTYLSLVFLFFASLAFAEPLSEGSGDFAIPGGKGRSEKEIRLYYHVPQTWKQDSPVVIVVPGAGRNGWSYRDAWEAESEEKGIVVVSPHYSKEFYPRFWNYNMARMIGNVEINKEKTDFESFSISKKPDEWIFSDFDRMFDIVKAKLGLETEQYDIFGHSAGGQILHRFAIFNSSKKVNRIVSSNSGWYTVPSYDTEFPTGLVNAPISKGDLKQVFSKNLVVFLGELDDENETRGHLVKNERMNKRGLHRLERCNYFYGTAREQARVQGYEFNWEKIVVPGVGHDYKKMSVAASKFLYAQ